MTYNPLTQTCIITKTDPTVITGFVGLVGTSPWMLLPVLLDLKATDLSDGL